jgi:hypothetical protein
LNANGAVIEFEMESHFHARRLVHYSRTMKSQNCLAYRHRWSGGCRCDFRENDEPNRYNNCVQHEQAISRDVLKESTFNDATQVLANDRVLAILALLTVRIRPVFWLFVVTFNLVGMVGLILD